MLCGYRSTSISSLFLFGLITWHTCYTQEHDACPDTTWMHQINPRRCFKIFQPSVTTFEGLRQFCQNDSVFSYRPIMYKADVATLHDRQTSDLVCTRVLKPGQDYTIGLKRIDGHFVWVRESKSLEYLLWDSDRGQPEEDKGCAYVIRINSTSCSWRSKSCQSPTPKVVCEIYNINPCESGACGEKGCNLTAPMRHECECDAGYEFKHDLKSCVDIDECKTERGLQCEGACINTEGDYRCTGFSGPQMGKSSLKFTLMAVVSLVMFLAIASIVAYLILGKEKVNESDDVDDNDSDDGEAVRVRLSDCVRLPEMNNEGKEGKEGERREGEDGLDNVEIVGEDGKKGEVEGEDGRVLIGFEEAGHDLQMESVID